MSITYPKLFCEFHDDGSDVHEHDLRKWDVVYTRPGVLIESGRFLREHRAVVTAGCSYAAEEALYDLIERRHGDRDADVHDLREVPA